MKAVEWWKPEEKRTPGPKKRKPYKLSGEPYQKGVKEYLASFEVGEIRKTKEMKYGSLRAIAWRLFCDFGCKFKLCRTDDTIIIMRIR